MATGSMEEASDDEMNGPPIPHPNCRLDKCFSQCVLDPLVELSRAVRKERLESERRRAESYE